MYVAIGHVAKYKISFLVKKITNQVDKQFSQKLKYYFD